MVYERKKDGSYERKKDKNLLFLENVYKSYGDKQILNDIDLSVSEGEFCSVVGPSGCGKSTLLRIILGQERASKGKVLFDGKPIEKPDPTRGIVYQRYGLYPNKTVLENVMMGSKLQKGIKGFFNFNLSAEKEEAMKYLKRVKLADASAKYPHELSGGMQQRVAIAQALITHPSILLMDEPFGALDPGTREAMQLFLSELWEEYKMTIFFVTHDLEEAVFLGTRLLVISPYYSQGEKSNIPTENHKGSRIVTDLHLFGGASNTKLKERPEFGQLIQKVRQDGFDPEYLQHVTDFNLSHADSFQTLTKEDLGLPAKEIN